MPFDLMYGSSFLEARLFETYDARSEAEEAARLLRLYDCWAFLERVKSNRKVKGEMNMSWSVNASGRPSEVVESLKKQFESPLAEPPAGLADEGERETVARVMEMIAQCAGTFDPERTMAVYAYGHMGYNDPAAKTGGYQNVHVDIKA